MHMAAGPSVQRQSRGHRTVASASTRLLTRKRAIPPTNAVRCRAVDVRSCNEVSTVCPEPHPILVVRVENDLEILRRDALPEASAVIGRPGVNPVSLARRASVQLQGDHLINIGKCSGMPGQWGGAAWRWLAGIRGVIHITGSLVATQRIRASTAVRGRELSNHATWVAPFRANQHPARTASALARRPLNVRHRCSCRPRSSAPRARPCSRQDP
jgi:hypothetical protein